MKFFSTKFVLALLTVLSCAGFAIGQDQPNQPASGYNYKEINYPGAADTFVYAINDHGEIVGYYTGGGCSQPACGFSDLKGTFTTIQCALENYTELFDVSNTGEIIGAYSFVGGMHGLMWEGNSSCFDIVDPSGPNYTEAWGVNDSGEIVGYYLDSANNFQGFTYIGGTYSTISCSQGSSTMAIGVNNAGLIVGDYANSTTGPYSGFVYRAEKCVSIVYPSAVSTGARGINKRNQISGWYVDSGNRTHGFSKAGTTYQ
jgi:hypothetical protein